MMQRSNLSKLIKDNSTWITRFFGTVPSASKSSSQEPMVDPWVESHTEQTFSGGYNEAFVVQFWASYNLK
jgi:hypothetical protein